MHNIGVHAEKPPHFARTYVLRKAESANKAAFQLLTRAKPDLLGPKKNGSRAY